MKRLKVGLLALAVLLSLLAGTAGGAAAVAPKYTNEADILHALGLFNGTDKGFELERTPTRTEALVLLIRLLGKQSEAEACTDTHPFSDVPAWADRYVAWAYSKGLTKGVTDTAFGGTADASAAMFVTFILRALGYDDKTGDFSYDTALAKAADIGLISPGVYDGTAGFYRDDCAHLCYAALTAKLNHSGKTLASKLVSDGVISGAAARNYGLLPTRYTVACVGDSFTAGFGLKSPDKQAYPGVLTALTGDFTFATETYSTPMVTVNTDNHLAFIRTPTYTKSLGTSADIILLVMGANDAIWTPGRADLAEDYKKLLESYINLPQGPKVIVLTPPRLLGLREYDDKMAVVVETEKNVARELGLEVIDVHAFSEGMSSYTDDKVHFNAEGHRLVAEYIYKAMSEILSK
jgi:lysophospholipase L1-like esterase